MPNPPNILVQPETFITHLDTHNHSASARTWQVVRLSFISVYREWEDHPGYQQILAHINKRCKEAQLTELVGG